MTTPSSNINGGSKFKVVNLGLSAANTISNNLPSVNVNQKLLDDLNVVLKCSSLSLAPQGVDIASPKLRQIRIYLCSTYSDFKEERDVFWTEILPELQQHCLQYGVDVLLFDPFHASGSDVIYQPHSFPLQLKQIRKCREQSEGLFFVCFVGDKYGPCPLPVTLKVKEYQQIFKAAKESGKDFEIVNTWYKLDTNSSQHCYQLQDNEQKQIDPKTYNRLLDVIQNGYKDEQQFATNMYEESENRFFTSSVEQCVQYALEIDKNHQSNSLFLLRSLEASPGTSTNNNLVEFYDEDVSNATKEKLCKFRSFINQNLDKPNLETLKVAWQQKNNSSASLNGKEWEKYLEKFSQQTTYKLKQLIDKNYASGVHWNRGCTLESVLEAEIHFNTNCMLRTAYESAWHHYRELCERKHDRFVGQSDSLSKLKDLCKKALKKPCPPIIIVGDDVFGKTTLLCETASLVKTWLGTSVITVIRFANLNVTSKFAHELLRGMCMQICVVFDLTQIYVQYKDFYTTEKMAEWFDSACAEAAKKPGQVLLILVDDVYSLKYGGHVGGRVLTSIPWIPALLPKNVIFIATAAKNVSVDRLPLKKSDSVNFVQMQNFKDSDLMMIAKSCLISRNRVISTDQESAIKKSVKGFSNPFYSLLLGANASKWSSSHSVNGQALSSSLTSLIEEKLERLEQIFSFNVCASVCSFIECGQYGLTESEIMDLLTQNKELIQNQTSDQEDSKAVCSFPCLIWIAFRENLDSLLVERIFDGKTIYCWSNATVSNIIRCRYLRSSLQLIKCHSNIADLYRYNDESDDQRSVGDNQTNFKFIVPQSLWSFHPSTGELIYNRRCAYNFWYHLLHAGSISDFERQSLCNFHYLETVLNVGGLTHLLTVLEDALMQLLNHNLHILYGAIIRPAVDTISCCRSLFASELIGRLNYTRILNTPFLNNLLDQAMSWVDNDCSLPLIVPLTSWVRPPLCPLVISLQLQDWHCSTTLIQPTNNYQHLIVAGMPNGRICMYHILSNTVVKNFTGHTDRVLCLEMSRNGYIFATSSADNTVRTWDLQQGTCIQCMSPHVEKVLCMLFADDDSTLFTGSTDCSIRMTRLEKCEMVRTFTGHTGPIHTLTINNQNEYLISGSSDFVVLVWNIESASIVFKLGGLMAPVSAIALTNDDAFLLVACVDETLRVFSLCLAKELHECRGHEGKICSFAISPDDCQVFAGSSDGNIYCYDLHTGQLLSTQNCHTVAVSSLKITNDGHFLISACAENIHVWNIDRPIEVSRQELSNYITVVALSRDFKYLAAGNNVGIMLLWDLEFCQCVWATHDNPPTKITYLTFDVEASLLFMGSSDGTVCVWSMFSGCLLRKYKGLSHAVQTIQIFPGRSRILSRDCTGVAKVWKLIPPELEDEERDVDFKGIGDLIRLVNDKDMLANPTEMSKEIKIWNVSEDVPFVRAKLTHNDVITCLIVSSDGKVVVTGSADQSLKVWEVATGYLTQILVGHEGTVSCCALSDDCQSIVSGSLDKTSIAWEVETGSVLSSFSESSKDIMSVALTCEGNVALTGCKDGWLFAWATENGRKLASFNAHAPIAEIKSTREAHRIVLRLDQCPKVAIVCLHNTPTFGDSDATRRRKQSRTLSISSIGSAGSFMSTSSANLMHAPSSPPLTSPGGVRMTPPISLRIGSGLPEDKSKERLGIDRSKDQQRKSSKVFECIERSRSKGSLYDSSTSAASKMASGERSKQYGAPTNQNNASKVCVIL